MRINNVRIITYHVTSRLALKIERHCRRHFAPRFSGRATSNGFYVVLQLLRLHVCMHVPTRALWQTQKERRGLTLKRREDCRAQWWMSAGLNFAKFQALPVATAISSRLLALSPSFVLSLISRVKNAWHWRTFKGREMPYLKIYIFPLSTALKSLWELFISTLVCICKFYSNILHPLR